jgi:phosphohistidine phosphatase
MILYILRHAVAENDAPDGDDGARRLTEGGRQKMIKAARGLRAAGVEYESLLTSPLVRAAETAEIVAAAFPGGPKPKELEALATGVSPAQSVAALAPYARHASVMIVGHEPGLSHIAALLMTGSADAPAITLKKGGCIALELSSISPRGGATLSWMLTPRQLRRLGK